MLGLGRLPKQKCLQKKCGSDHHQSLRMRLWLFVLGERRQLAAMRWFQPGSVWALETRNE